MAFNSELDQNGYGSLSFGASNSELMRVLMDTQDLVPGKSPSYEACKTLYTYHPIGSRMVDKPLEIALSQERIIEVPGGPEEELIEAFRIEEKKIGSIGSRQIIFRVMQLSRIYGIGTLFVNYVDADGNRAPTADPLPMDRLWELDLYFNLYDPLNTAGSLVLNQDPSAIDFMHPKQVSVGADILANSKTLVVMNEQPIWIQWSDSAFGFVGRSVYQRAYYPLKSVVSAMIANELIQAKLGLLVHKAKTPGSTVDRRALSFFGMKRQAIKGAQTGNVLQIGVDEDVASLNLEHVRDAGEYSRTNIIKDIATGSGTPAALLNEETLTEGFGEGTEDAKQIASYIDGLRRSMEPAFMFMDALVRRRAWNPEFYREIQRKYPERYAKLKYEAAYQEWSDAFRVTWPNLLTEPDSEKAKAAQIKLEAAQKIAESLLKVADPETKGTICAWLADVVNDQKEFYSSPLVIDADAIASYVPPSPIGPGDEDQNES